MLYEEIYRINKDKSHDCVAYSFLRHASQIIISCSLQYGCLRCTQNHLTNWCLVGIVHDACMQNNMVFVVTSYSACSHHSMVYLFVFRCLQFFPSNFTWLMIRSHHILCECVFSHMYLYSYSYSIRCMNMQAVDAVLLISSFFCVKGPFFMGDSKFWVLPEENIITSMILFLREK